MLDRAVAEGRNFDGLMDALHDIGRNVIAPRSADVDKDARFPWEAFEALKSVGLLGAYVPRHLGGMGLDVIQIARMCESLAMYCGSTAMIYAMHNSQVACIVHHGLESAYFRDYLESLAVAQRLLASATTEIGIGGDLRSSKCALETASDGRFTLVKQAPVISYGVAADDILVSCRRHPDAAPSDQAQVLVHRDDTTLTQLSNWDTLGFRGTCSAGFALAATGRREQVVPAPFEEILGRTMHPYAHIVWSAVWLGLSTDAVQRAARHVRSEARKNPDGNSISAMRLAEVDHILMTMRSNVKAFAEEYQRMHLEDVPESFQNFGFVIRANNLKVASSRALIEIVNLSMGISGISGYRNDSGNSLCRHIRDAHGAAIMVHNDRILNHNSVMLKASRGP